MTEQNEPDGEEPTVDGESNAAGNGSDAARGDAAVTSAGEGATGTTDTGATTAETGEAADDTAGEASDAPGGVDETLVERVAESDPEEIALELASLRTRVDGLESELESRESEVEELTDKLKRKQADFQNYKKRMEKRREEEKQRAAEDLVTRLLDVRDNLKRALDQDEGTDIRGGVESTLRQFDDELDAENVEVIEPEPGEDVDPHRHEVLVRVDSDQPEGTIADVHRPGYLMADAVLREAQVTVSDGSEE